MVAIIGRFGMREIHVPAVTEPAGDTDRRSIYFEGTDITDASVDINKIRQKIGMVFQQFNLFPHKIIKENIMLAPVKLGVMSVQEASGKADTLLQRVGLPEKADAYPGKLSGGQNKRLPLRVHWR